MIFFRCFTDIINNTGTESFVLSWGIGSGLKSKLFILLSISYVNQHRKFYKKCFFLHGRKNIIRHSSLQRKEDGIPWHNLFLIYNNLHIHRLRGLPMPCFFRSFSICISDSGLMRSPAGFKRSAPSALGFFIFEDMG